MIADHPVPQPQGTRGQRFFQKIGQMGPNLSSLQIANNHFSCLKQKTTESVADRYWGMALKERNLG